jgi:hypothetical protein
MFGRVLVGGLVLGTLLCWTGAALAGEWAWPVEGRVGLAYAEPWTDASGRLCSHGGIDLEAPVGARVSACVGGRVAFAGRVPATGGGTALAVSVVTPDGLRVTYLPLASCSVVAGTEITAGEPIGELAGSGDGSLAASHLHLSVRRGEAPIDPATLLGSSVAPDTWTPAADAPATGSPPVVRAPAARGHAGPTVARQAPAPAPAPAGVAAMPVATGVSAAAPVAPATLRPAAWLAPRIEARIRPLPYAPRLNTRVAMAQARALASAGRGLAIRALLALLAALTLAQAVRAASRRAARVSTLEPVPAHARRVRG